MIILIIIFLIPFVIFFFKFKKNLKIKNNEQFMRKMERSPKKRSRSDIAHYEKIRAQKVGSTRFIWHSAGDSGCCVECAKNNGKKFKWDSPPKTGLPGEGKMCTNGECRCWAEAIIPPPSRKR